MTSRAQIDLIMKPFGLSAKANRPSLKPRARGVTLVEIGAVISVISLLVISGMYFYNRISESNQTSTAARDVAAIVSSVIAWSGDGSVYKTSTERLDFEEINDYLPRTLREHARSANDLQLTNANPWGGDYTLRLPSSPSQNRYEWSLTIEDVPDALQEALQNQFRNAGYAIDACPGDDCQLTFGN